MCIYMHVHVIDYVHTMYVAIACTCTRCMERQLSWDVHMYITCKEYNVLCVNIILSISLYPVDIPTPGACSSNKTINNS